MKCCVVVCDLLLCQSRVLAANITAVSARELLSRCGTYEYSLLILYITHLNSASVYAFNRMVDFSTNLRSRNLRYLDFVYFFSWQVCASSIGRKGLHGPDVRCQEAGWSRLLGNQTNRLTAFGLTTHATKWIEIIFVCVCVNIHSIVCTVHPFPLAVRFVVYF